MEKTAVAMAAAAFTTLTSLLLVSHIGGIFFSCFVLFQVAAAGGTGVGVNYGRLGSKLPPPGLVARFLDQNTLVDRVRVYDADPAVLEAFAATSLALDVAIPNDDIPGLASLPAAQRWVRDRLLPHSPRAHFSRLLVGNEVASTSNRSLLASLVPAMQNLHTALAGASLQARIKVTSPHSMGVLAASDPPSSGRFREGYDEAVVRPLLGFLRATGAPFAVNAYPYFGLAPDTLDYALFRRGGVVDPSTGLAYGNMLDAQVDAVLWAMRRMGFPDVEVVVAETGWPSKGEAWEVAADVESAREYNANVVRRVSSGVGTPLMPGRRLEASLFSLFDEDLKPGPASERHFGLFTPDMAPVYDVGIMKPTGMNGMGSGDVPPAPLNPAPASVRSWCQPKPSTEDRFLQVNIDFVCGQRGLDCGPIQSGGSCFDPDTVPAHAAYAMNEYYQSTGRDFAACDFAHTGLITLQDPSYGSCKYSS